MPRSTASISHVLQDPKKFARGMQLLQMNEEIKTAKKVSSTCKLRPRRTPNSLCRLTVGTPLWSSPRFPFYEPGLSAKSVFYKDIK